MGFLDWAELPQNLLDSILHRLPSASDFVRFSVVCRSWHAVAKDNLREHSPPMLLTYSGEQEIWNLCDMTNERVLDLQLELPNTRFCGFSKGWLVTMDKKFIVALINPFSKIMGRRVRRPTADDSTIALPPIHPPEMSNDQYRTKWTKYHEYFVYKAILSADPVSSRKDCIVVVIYGNRGRLALFRLEDDTRWTYIDAGITEHIFDIVYAQDKLYALDYENKVFSCDISISQLKFTLVAESFEQPLSFCKTYMLDSSDGKGLLMIHRYMQSRQRRHRPRITVAFRVFKLDAYHGKWAEIYTLGDVSLFLGDSVISVMASNFLGCEPNCIYFIHDWESLAFDRFPRPRDFGVYDLTEKGFFRFGDAATPIKMSNRTPIWTMANIKL